MYTLLPPPSRLTEVLEVLSRHQFPQQCSAVLSDAEPTWEADFDLIDYINNTDEEHESWAGVVLPVKPINMGMWLITKLAGLPAQAGDAAWVYVPALSAQIANKFQCPMGS